jgi:hypothetical protein
MHKYDTECVYLSEEIIINISAYFEIRIQSDTNEVHGVSISVAHTDIDCMDCHISFMPEGGRHQFPFYSLPVDVQASLKSQALQEFMESRNV